MLASGLGGLVRMKGREGTYLVVGVDSGSQSAVLLSATDWRLEKQVPYEEIEPMRQDAAQSLRSEAAD